MARSPLDGATLLDLLQRTSMGRAPKSLAGRRAKARQRRIGEANTRASSEVREKLGKLVERIDRAAAESATKIEKAVRPTEPSPYGAESFTGLYNVQRLGCPRPRLRAARRVRAWRTWSVSWARVELLA